MTPRGQRQILAGAIAGGAAALIFSAIFIIRTELRPEPCDGAKLSLDLCRDELRDAEAICLELTQKHDAERAELRDRILKMSEQLHDADERAMNAAKELKCGKELLFEQWRADGCEKRLKGRIMQCPCVNVEDMGDPDDHGAAEGF